MKSFIKSMALAIGVISLTSGLALAQTTTFKNGCTTLDTCGITGGTNRLIETSGGNFFFQEQVVIDGKLLNHMIVRGPADGNTGSTFSQETFTPGGAVQSATNTSSIDALTFKQSLTAGGAVNSLVRMDNLNIILKSSEPGMVNSTEIHVTQSIVDPTFGLNNNSVTLTPNTSTPELDFITSITQNMTDPTTPTFSSDFDFDTGTPATVNQSF